MGLQTHASAKKQTTPPAPSLPMALHLWPCTQWWTQVQNHQEPSDPLATDVENLVIWNHLATCYSRREASNFRSLEVTNYEARWRWQGSGRRMLQI